MPYWRLSGFYFFYFATLGALVPYWGLYLQSVGFTARDIGNLMALLMISRIVAPNVWAWFADHRQNRMRVVRYSAFLTPVTFAGVLLGADFWWLALVMLLFSFFWHASLPLLEVLVMQHTGARPGAYGACGCGARSASSRPCSPSVRSLTRAARAWCRWSCS